MRAVLRRTLIILIATVAVGVSTATPASADEPSDTAIPIIAPIINLILGPGSCC